MSTPTLEKEQERILGLIADKQGELDKANALAEAGTVSAKAPLAVQEELEDLKAEWFRMEQTRQRGILKSLPDKQSELHKRQEQAQAEFLAGMGQAYGAVTSWYACQRELRDLEGKKNEAVHIVEGTTRKHNHVPSAPKPWRWSSGLGQNNEDYYAAWAERWFQTGRKGDWDAFTRNPA